MQELSSNSLLKTDSPSNILNAKMKIKQDIDWYLKQLIKLGTSISELEDSNLAPSPVTNTLFNQLVATVREFPSFDVTPIFAHPTIKRLQPIVTEKCSKAEYLLEADFAKQVIVNGTKLSDFMYYENYELLIEFEVRSLEKYMFPGRIQHISQVAIIGSGPLPLTSIVLQEHLRKSAKITNYDHNEEANLLGQAVVKSVQGNKRISFVTCSALDLNLDSQLANADLVYLAALVGKDSEEKEAIISHLHKIMKPGSILIARSATGLRKFIYHPVGKEEFQEFEQFRQFDPDNKVIINSIVVGKKLGKKLGVS